LPVSETAADRNTVAVTALRILMVFIVFSRFRVSGFRAASKKNI